MKVFCLTLLLSFTLLGENPLISEPVIPADQIETYNEVIKIMETQPSEALKKISEVNQPSPAFLLIKGILLKKQGNKKVAKESFQSALKELPLFYKARVHLAYLFLEEKNYKSALPHLLTIIQLGRGDGSTWQNLTICYMKLDKLKAAEESLRQLRLYKDDDRDIDLALMDIRWRQKNFQAAYGLAVQMVDSDITDKASWKLMINCLIQLDKEDQALKNMIVYSKLFKLDDTERNQMAGLYYNQEFYNEAAKLYQQVSGSLKKTAHLRAAQSLIYIDKYDQVLELLSKPLKSYSPGDFISYHLFRAESFAALNKKEDSLKELLQILRYDTMNGRVNFKIAELFEDKKDYESALDYYTRSSKDSDIAVISHLRSARIYALKKNYDLAIQSAQKADSIENSSRTKSFIQKLKTIRDSGN